MKKANEDENKPEVNKAGQKLRDDFSGLYETGRPPKPFDPKMFEELCNIQCTKIEICAVLGMANTTLDRKIHEFYDDTFDKVYKAFKESGKASLRRAQFKSAIASENVTMQKWLGMQYLDQKQVTSSELMGEGGGPIEFESRSPADRIRSKLQRFTAECPAEDTEE